MKTSEERIKGKAGGKSSIVFEKKGTKLAEIGEVPPKTGKGKKGNYIRSGGKGKFLSSSVGKKVPSHMEEGGQKGQENFLNVP